jgi:hypothetical protein
MIGQHVGRRARQRDTGRSRPRDAAQQQPPRDEAGRNPALRPNFARNAREA